MLIHSKFTLKYPSLAISLGKIRNNGKARTGIKLVIPIGSASVNQKTDLFEDL